MEFLAKSGGFTAQPGGSEPTELARPDVTELLLHTTCSPSSLLSSLKLC